MKISKEWKIVLLLSFFITLFTQIPLIVGYIQQTESEIFMGIPIFVTDTNNHLHWMLQAKEGNILFTNKFTHEEVPALIFNPYHFLIGTFSRISSIPIIYIFHIVSIMSIFGFLTYLYVFISHFTKDKKTRLYSFLFASLGSGFGFFWYLSKKIFDKWIVSADLWVADMNVFRSFGHPHFTISMILIMAVLLHGYKSLKESGTNKNAFIAGFSGLLLGFVHIFDVVTIAVVLFSWFSYLCISQKKFDKNKFLKLSIIGGIISPSVIYYLWIILFNPSYSEWNSLNQTITPLPHELISGFGILLLFAAITIYRKRKSLDFLSIWVIANFILVYLPINVQRRFLLGIGIPLAILSAQAYTRIIIPWLKSKKIFYVGTLLITILLFSTTVYITAKYVGGLHETGNEDFSNSKYLSHFELDALMWIEESIPNDAIIISPLKIGNHIPARTSNRVYLGHWAQTINYDWKKDQIGKFYLGEQADVDGDLIWVDKSIANQLNYSDSLIAYENEKIALVYHG